MPFPAAPAAPNLPKASRDSAPGLHGAVKLQNWCCLPPPLRRPASSSHQVLNREWRQQEGANTLLGWGKGKLL